AGGESVDEAAGDGPGSLSQADTKTQAATAARRVPLMFPSSLPRARRPRGRPLRLLDRVPVRDDAVADLVGDGFLGVEPVVAVEVLLDLLERLAGLARVELAALLAQAEELLRRDGDVGGGAADH